MKIRLSKSILLCIISILLIGAVVGCSLFTPIIGTWESTSAGSTIEFTSDGHIVYELGDYRVSGTYELIGDDVVEVDFAGLGGTLLTTLGGSTWKYTINDGTMTIKAGGITTTYNKV